MQTHVTFNDPQGTSHNRDILDEVIKYINSASRGSEIRFAVYSFADQKTLHALAKAHSRGVHIYACIDSHGEKFPAGKELKKILGDQCFFANRRGVTHSKFWTFSHIMAAVVTSSNWTSYATNHQYADSITFVEKPDLYQAMVAHHKLMMDERPPIHKGWFDGVELYTFPFERWTPKTDPVAMMLHSFPVGAELMISMHAWQNKRGLDLVHDIITRRPKETRIIFGKGTGYRIPMAFPPKFDKKYLNTNAEHTHQKLMLAHWPNHHIIVTGSDNWTAQSLKNDEMVVKVNNMEIFHRYRENFDKMWKRAHIHK